MNDQNCFCTCCDHSLRQQKFVSQGPGPGDSHSHPRHGAGGQGIVTTVPPLWCESTLFFTLIIVWDSFSNSGKYVKWTINHGFIWIMDLIEVVYSGESLLVAATPGAWFSQRWCRHEAIHSETLERNARRDNGPAPLTGGDTSEHPRVQVRALRQFGDSGDQSVPGLSHLTTSGSRDPELAFSSSTRGSHSHPQQFETLTIISDQDRTNPSQLTTSHQGPRVHIVRYIPKIETRIY